MYPWLPYIHLKPHVQEIRSLLRLSYETEDWILAQGRSYSLRKKGSPVHDVPGALPNARQGLVHANHLTTRQEKTRFYIVLSEQPITMTYFHTLLFTWNIYDPAFPTRPIYIYIMGCKKTDFIHQGDIKTTTVTSHGKIISVPLSTGWQRATRQQLQTKQQCYQF